MAKQCKQFGWIANTDQGVQIELEGDPEQQQIFISRLQHQAPPFTKITTLTVNPLPPTGFKNFIFHSSLGSKNKSSFVLPDIATCPDCIAELFDPTSRFYRYAFISCCHCDPRYSILKAQPYDRITTTMAEFKFCATCEQDYQNPDNRRFHAQTIACSECGPTLSLLDAQGNHLVSGDPALKTAIDLLNDGKILAVKGIGGFQLIADADNEAAIANLRERKSRDRKPFALMVPSLTQAHQLCFINLQEESALSSPASPIVLLQRRANASISQSIAPDNQLLGLMLPYSPLHHLLLHDFQKPLIATSGNLQSEPICIDNQHALDTLSNSADFFLTHNRDILRPLDDSIVRQIGNKMTVLRRARGYVPTPISLPQNLSETLAVGGHLKNTVAVSYENQMVLSQHIGDLDSITSRQQFETTVSELTQLYQVNPKWVMHDAHSGYTSSQYAAELDIQTRSVQHHYAHILSCMAEHGLQPPVLGIAWDGTGLGDNQTLWGGEFLLITQTGFKRFAHFLPFPLPGGSKAVQEPKRAALGMLHQCLGDNWEKLQNSPSLQAFTTQEIKILNTALRKQLNTPLTSSVGRLFDAVASLSGLCHINHYEGEAAMHLESAAQTTNCDQSYPYQLQSGSPWVIDWKMMIEAILADYSNNLSELIAEKFHNTLAKVAFTIAVEAKQENIVLSGGCFQNDLLVKKILNCFQTSDFKIFQHENIPPNDGGLAVGQILASSYLQTQEKNTPLSGYNEK